MNTCMLCQCVNPRHVLGVQTLGGDKGKGRKAEGLKNEVAGLEAAVQAASQEYDRVKLRNTQVLTSYLACCSDASYGSHGCVLDF